MNLRASWAVALVCTVVMSGCGKCSGEKTVEPPPAEDQAQVQEPDADAGEQEQEATQGPRRDALEGGP
ncbi:MAG: hypothetical protein JRG91_20640, partial [Deltaproteobacteria bacterium]|nr:hypothetical protein [Deltaproteobacteria bacterium]